MIEFDTLCYLQNHKTGCTFVETFLRRFCRQPVRAYRKHAAWLRRDPGKFYFLNVREPLDAYLSLFNYGLDGKGEVFERLHARGHAPLYSQGMQGFAAWLRFVLDPAHAELVYPRESLALAGLVGLQSTRFLRLASPGFEQSAHSMTSRSHITDYLRQMGVVDEVIRFESMIENLTALIEGPLAVAIHSPADAVRWLRAAPRINASTRRDADTQPMLDQPTRALLMHREWYLFENFYEKEMSR